VAERELVEYLAKHLKWKTKYYAICQHVISRFKKTNDQMRYIIEKHSLEDIRDRLDYIAEKLCKYGTGEYPFRTLLVMDDFAASPLLEKVNSPISRFLTKTRHYHLTGIIVAQTWRYIILNLKRLATDVVVYAHFSEEDITKILKQTPNNCNQKEAIAKYCALEGKHDHFVMNITAGEYYFVRFDERGNKTREDAMVEGKKIPTTAAVVASGSTPSRTQPPARPPPRGAPVQSQPPRRGPQ
jgi:hypothetical protein